MIIYTLQFEGTVHSKCVNSQKKNTTTLMTAFHNCAETGDKKNILTRSAKTHTPVVDIDST